MCGICGNLNIDGWPVSREAINRMCTALAHRGPDDAGVYIGHAMDNEGQGVGVGLGHARLSVIDLSASGHQPMCNEDGSVWIVYNGEIYNFKSLKEDLVRRGHKFVSDTDTEVIIHLYEEEGPEAVRHLNGMFAFALWDACNARLWLCRDRVGIKPLVYGFDGRRLAFASEIKALRELPEFDTEIDREALSLYLAFNYIPAPYTIHRGIRKLPPGSSMVWENGQIRIWRYWKVRQGPIDYNLRNPSAAEGLGPWKKRLFAVMTDAVVSRMIADVPLGAFLSGGIDSSIIVALMARHSSQPVKTFSIGFKDADLFDETRYAREMAKLYQTDHHEFKLSGQDMIDVFENALGALDEPFADSSAIPAYIVSMHTRRHVTVALSGDGGDELFAGYRSYLGEYWHPKYMNLPEPVRDAVEKAIAGLPDSRDRKWLEQVRRLKKFMNATHGSFPDRLLALKTVFPLAIRNKLLLHHAGSRTDSAAWWVERLLSEFSGDRINRMLYTDFADSLPGDMLHKVDMMSMQHALEVRVPFLDYRVVELAFSMGGDLKIRGFKTKYILKETFRHILPSSLMHRSKAGFEIPISQWLKNDLRFLLSDYLSKERIEAQGIFDFTTIQRLVSDLLENRTDTSWMLWNLIVFQYWYERHFRKGAG